MTYTEIFNDTMHCRNSATADLVLTGGHADKTNMNNIAFVDVNKTYLNPLKGRGNYIATSNNMKLVHWPLMGGLLH